MNYRHAFHAGNFADVFKHIVLVRILLHLREKPTPFRIIDTHAGAGLYDLATQAANRTAEWRDGIGRLADAPLDGAAEELIGPYLAVCRGGEPNAAHCIHYPGSPVIAARLLRPQDRLVACELEPLAALALARHLRAAPPARTFALPRGEAPSRSGARAQGKALRMDGWTALNTFVPPKERRGIVLIDPPYERADEFAHLAEGVGAALRKWPNGIYMMWYPVKDRSGPDRLARALRPRAAGRGLRAEFAVATTQPQSELSACGVIVLNPPWNLAAQLAVILPALATVLGRDSGRRYSIDAL